MLKDRLLEELEQEISRLQAIKNAASEGWYSLHSEAFMTCAQFVHLRGSCIPERGARTLRSKVKPEEKDNKDKLPRKRRNGTGTCNKNVAAVSIPALC